MNITASSLPLLVQCPGPAHPKTWMEKDKPGPAANFGNCIHTLAECHIKGKPIPVPEAMRINEVDASELSRVELTWRELQAWLDDIGVTVGQVSLSDRSEIPVAANVVTGEAKRLDIDGKRQYGIDLPWIAGTADIVMVANGVAHVWDIKTGSTRSDSYAEQLRFLGGAVMASMKLTKAIVYVAKVNQVEVDVDWYEEITPESWHETLARLRAVRFGS